MRALLITMVGLVGRSVRAKPVGAEPEYWNMRHRGLRSLTRWVAIPAAAACILIQGARPCVAEPTVYAGVYNSSTYDSLLYSIEVSTGIVNWFTPEKNGSATGVAAAREAPVVAFVTRYVLCLYNSNGDELWCQAPGTNFSTSLIEPTPVAISDDGEHIAVARYDSGNWTVELLDRDGEPIWSYGFAADSVAMTANGEHVVAGGSDGVAYWNDGADGWDSGDANPFWEVDETASSDDDTLTVAITRNTTNLHMVAGGEDGRVRLFAPDSAAPIWIFNSDIGDDKIHMSVDINAQGNRVAACNHDDNTSSSDVGAQLDLFRDDTDGTAGDWTETDGAPVWTFKPGAGEDNEDEWDCRALDFEMPTRGQLLMSVGRHWQVYQHDAEGTSTPMWTGNTPVNNHTWRLESLITDDNDWMIAVDSTTNNKDVVIYDALDGSDPQYTVSTKGPVKALSGREGAPPETTSSTVTTSGGTVSTGETATGQDPVETTVTVPSGTAGGLVEIYEGGITETQPIGFRFLGQQVDITAPAATVESPVVLTFSLFAPSWTAMPDEIFKAGVLVADCVNPFGTSADPDPCVESRSPQPTDDTLIVVRTSTTSSWNSGPEPSLLIQLASGLLGLAVLNKRRRRANG